MSNPFALDVLSPEPDIEIHTDRERFECTCWYEYIESDYINPPEYALIKECDNCKEGLTS